MSAVKITNVKLLTSVDNGAYSAEPVCASSVASRAVRLVDAQNYRDSAKFVAEISSLASDVFEKMNCTGLSLLKKVGDEFGVCQKLLAPFTVVDMTRRAVESSAIDGYSVVDRKFCFDYIKALCDSFRAVAYLSCSLALVELEYVVKNLKNIVSLMSDVLAVVDIFRKHQSCEDHVTKKDCLKIISNFFDSLLRLMLLGYLHVSLQIEMVIKLVGFATFITEKLLFPSSQETLAQMVSGIQVGQLIDTSKVK